MGLIKFISAIITRALFILIALIGVWRVTRVKEHNFYWLLTFLFLPLVLEMIITLRRRKGKDYKWFSPPIFLFLISIIPSMWLLELHHQQNKDSEPKCQKLDSLDLYNLIQNKTSRNLTITDSLKDIDELFSAVCANDWILALHQILLILLIVGKWLLPLGGGVTRDELSQLLLIFVGTAADILEFTSVWTWSMLQFPLHLAGFTPYELLTGRQFPAPWTVVPATEQSKRSNKSHAEYFNEVKALVSSFTKQVTAGRPTAEGEVPEAKAVWLKVIKRKWKEPRWTGPYEVTARTATAVRLKGKGENWYHWTQCAAADESLVDSDLAPPNTGADDSQRQNKSSPPCNGPNSSLPGRPKQEDQQRRRSPRQRKGVVTH
ncbi:transmembrane protein 26-like isoform X2 [Pelmatolapia mariae]|uniref:transmembrane protein 26-like isoform X2 n=1 Tax=Pelmatolapia mariae TaxID=158779 RepID=UPI002FE571F4